MKTHAAPIATVVQGHTFTIDSRYEPSKVLGRGSFGVVCTAFDKVRNENIAIKRIRPYANDEWDARHTLREIRLMKLMGNHPNIISLYDLSVFDDKAELYMMMELMDCDLHRIIQSKQALTEMHFKCFARQMLEGIKAMHEIGVFHRDLKPGNILVSKDCQLRITDFGLARFMDEVTLSGNNRQNPMTEYVVTRWYRCPELLLSPNLPYSAAIDLWSVGCIIGELVKRKPLFPGKSHADQVQLILEVKGYSNPRDLGFALSNEATTFLDRRCRYPPKSLNDFIQHASPQAMELIEALLELNPENRPSAAQSLEYPFLHDAQLVCDYSRVELVTRVDEAMFDFEKNEYTLADLQKMIKLEVTSPCDDSNFRSSPTTRNAPGLLKASSQSNKGKSETHNRSQSEQSSTEADENYNTVKSNSSSMVATEKRIYDNFSASEKSIQNNSNASSADRRVIARSGSAVSSISQTSNIAKSSNVRGPPTPSPKKVEAIAKQEKKQKRRFFLQGIQKITNQKDEVVGGANESEELTHRNGYITANKVSQSIIRPISHNKSTYQETSAKAGGAGYEEVVGKFERASLTARDPPSAVTEYSSTAPPRKLSTAPPASYADTNASANESNVTKFPVISSTRSFSRNLFK